MRKVWLHFIETSHYTRPQFLREAATLGITRRIDRRVLERFEFGDVVYLATKSGSTPILFAKFVVSTLSGFSRAEIEALAKTWELRCVDIGGQLIERECGDYQALATFEVVGERVSIARALELCAELEPDERGKWMVGGEPIELEPVRLVSMKKRLPRGFRLFDADSFTQVCASVPKPARGFRRVKGFFYVDKDAPPSNVVRLDEFRGRRVQEVHNYRGRK